MPQPLSSLVATTIQILVLIVGLVVGLGFMSQSDGGNIVAFLGAASGLIVQFGNAIYALAHAKVAAAAVNTSPPTNTANADEIRATLVRVVK